MESDTESEIVDLDEFSDRWNWANPSSIYLPPVLGGPIDEIFLASQNQGLYRASTPYQPTQQDLEDHFGYLINSEQATQQDLANDYLMYPEIESEDESI